MPEKVLQIGSCCFCSNFAVFNPYQPGFAFLLPENFRKPLGFLMFLGGIEK